MLPKTTMNWLLIDIWCYLFIACFDWKIGVSQQTAVRVCYILKSYVKLKLGWKLLSSLRNWMCFSSPWVHIKNMLLI